MVALDEGECEFRDREVHGELRGRIDRLLGAAGAPALADLVQVPPHLHDAEVLRFPRLWRHGFFLVHIPQERPTPVMNESTMSSDATATTVAN